MKYNKKKFIVALVIVFIVTALAIIWVKLPAGFLSEILGYIGKFAINTIKFLGYPGIVILMALESMIFPLPSELVMPFAGFLAEEGKMNIGLIILFSSMGSLLGSVISYYLGYYGGNKLVLKLGKYLLLDVADLEKAEKWFQKSGSKTIFICRFVPVIRHLISIPAGIGKMNFKKFCLYTVIGATMWNSILTYCGYALGKNWEMVRNYSEEVSMVTAVLLVVGSVFVIYRHVKNKNVERKLINN
ncbi:MAG: DedA family protein [Patescibacteria group bacterium]|jgi:membrane protein DedA with SNARE-associated domain